jgi:hypothetical protein
MPEARFLGTSCTLPELKISVEIFNRQRRRHSVEYRKDNGAYLRSMNHCAFSHYYSLDGYWKPELVGAYLEAAAYAKVH